MQTYPKTDAEMSAFWTELGEFWVEKQVRMDERLAPYGDAMMKAAAPQPGEVGLDIGCGCGDTTLALAKAVAPGGDALGLDVSAPMLSHARVRAEREGARAAFVEGDATRAPLPQAHFDLAISRFGVMFFEDPTQAFAHIRTALKPGARLVFVCWRKLDENPWMKNMNTAVAPFGPPPPPPNPEAPGPFSFGNPDRVQRILQQAGYRNISLEPFDWPMDMGLDVESAVSDYVRTGSAVALLNALADEQRERAVAAIRAVMQAHLAGDRVRMGSAAWIVSARTG